jgi:hypothetical protein
LGSENESVIRRDIKIEATIKRLEKESALEYENYKKGSARLTSHFADHYDIDLATNPKGEVAKTKVLLMGKVLERVKFEAARNIELVIVIWPAVFDVLTDNSIVARKDLSRYERYDYKNLTAPMVTICKSLGSHCVNLVDEFVKNNPETLFLK